MGGNRSTGPEMLEIMSRSDVSPEDDSAMRTLVKPQSLGYGTALEMLHGVSVHVCVCLFVYKLLEH